MGRYRIRVLQCPDCGRRRDVRRSRWGSKSDRCRPCSDTARGKASRKAHFNQKRIECPDCGVVRWVWPCVRARRKSDKCVRCAHQHEYNKHRIEHACIVCGQSYHTTISIAKKRTHRTCGVCGRRYAAFRGYYGHELAVALMLAKTEMNKLQEVIDERES